MSDKVLKEEELENISGGRWVYDEVVSYNWMCKNPQCTYNRMSFETQSPHIDSCPECGSTDIIACGSTTQYVKRWESEN